MTDDRSLERAARSWLEEGPTQAPDRPVEAALARIQSTKQERGLWVPWRLPTMNPIIRLATMAIVAAIAVGGAIFALRPTSQVGPPADSIEGTWEATFSRAAMLAAGLADAGEDDPSNYGHFVLSIESGTWSNVQLVGPNSTAGGTYLVDGSTVTLHTTTGETFPMPFTVTGTTLTFGLGGPVTFRVTPWTRIAAPVPVASAATVTLATYKAARDAICVAARPERQAYDARFGNGLYDAATHAADRAAKLAAFEEFATWAGQLIDKLDGLPVPSSMAVDESIAIGQSRGTLALIREEFPLIQAGKLAQAQSLDQTTDPLSRDIESYETRYGLAPCP